MSDLEKTIVPDIFIVSGGKGLTGDYVVKTLLAQFPDFKITTTILADVHSEEDARKAVQTALQAEGVIVHTMVDKRLRVAVNSICHELGVPSFDLMGQLSDFLTCELGVEPISKPGLFRKTNQAYFDRVSAIEYTLSADDGMNPDGILRADIVLTGISRTGKTPLSVYLAMFGWKVANVPLVNGIEPPEELFKADSNRIFGLSINIHTLIAQRKRRVAQMGNFDSNYYLNPRLVNEELEFAHRQFRKGGFTIIDVSNKPIESTANEILNHIQQRFDCEEQKIRQMQSGTFELPNNEEA
jgi:[pyruvate, water dikinase]-phosphate phosphotransferase / [pyruvate, water dikinase] kinase